MKNKQVNMKQNFKEKLISLREEFLNYLRMNGCEGVPTKELSAILQKYFDMRPSSLQKMLSKSTIVDTISWDQLLKILEDEIELRDKVTKLQKHTPSIVDINFSKNTKSLNQLLFYAKQKQSNIMKNIFNLNLVGTNILCVVMEREVIFFNIIEEKIVKILNFKYQKVIEKMIGNKKRKRFSSSYSQTNSEVFDKVNPISRRTQEFFSLKSRNNTNSEQLKGIINSKKSKMESSVCSDFSQMKRSFTDVQRKPRLTRFSSQIKKKDGESIRVRSNDSKGLFKLLTQTEIGNSIEIMKAFSTSKENFEKYVSLDKKLIKKEKEEEFVSPGTVQVQKDFLKQLAQIRKTTKQLSLKRKNEQPIKILKKSKEDVFKREKKKMNGCDDLQKKPIDIVDCSFAENYLLASLVNREVRLYQLKKSLYSYNQQLLLEKCYQNIVFNVLLYKSTIRQLYNMMVAEDKGSGIKIVVYELDSKMTSQKQVFTTSLNYMPVFRDMLPLGVGGFTEKGHFFMIELNSPVNGNCESKPIDSLIVNPRNGSKVSLTACKMHTNLISIYMGSKEGQLFLFDRIIKNIRQYNKVSTGSIKHIELIHSGDIIFYDSKEQVGIVNSTNLQIASITYLTYDNNIRKFHSLLKLQEDRYMFYSNKDAGFMNLSINEEKNFENTKYKKILNSHKKMMIKNIIKLNKNSINIDSTNNKYSVQVSHNNNRIVVVTSDGQIIVYDSEMQYVGSYFTIHTKLIIQITICAKNKYMGILWENNDIDVINLYSQETIISLSSKEEVLQIFFCHSSLFFFGYLTQPTQNLHLYSQTGKQLINKNIKSRLQWTCINSVKFHKGFMIMVYQSEVIILQKKTYLNYFLINLRTIDKLKQTNDEQAFRIRDTKINYDTGVMSMLLGNGFIAQVKYEYKSIIIVQNNTPYISYNMLHNKQQNTYHYLYVHAHDDDNSMVYDVVYMDKTIATFSVQPFLIGQLVVVRKGNELEYYGLDGNRMGFVSI